MATGGREKVPVVLQRYDLPAGRGQAQETIPKHGNRTAQFGADGSFCQFFILPVSVADFSATQHRMKGNKMSSISNTLELLEMIKDFPKK